MHTARQLDQELFQIKIAGKDAARSDLLVDWVPLSRFGIVVTEPFGAIGASYLLQLSITAFFDVRPQRRDRSKPVYPEVYVFHVGGRYGDHMYFDVFPLRKEVFVENDPVQVLEAINDRGVTHLAVPDGPVHPARHAWKEPAQALDRLSAAWAYSPDGRTEAADVEISASSPRADANAKVILHPDRSYQEQQQARAAVGDVVIPDDQFLVEFPDRKSEVSPETRDRIRDGRMTLRSDGTTTESYRRISPDDALCMLRR